MLIYLTILQSEQDKNFAQSATAAQLVQRLCDGLNASSPIGGELWQLALYRVEASLTEPGAWAPIVDCYDGTGAHRTDVADAIATVLRSWATSCTAMRQLQAERRRERARTAAVTRWSMPEREVD